MSTSRPADEETPLLESRDQSETRKETPVPWAQFGLVLFLQLAEPLTSQVIFPFTPQLIREIGVTHGDDKQVGYYVGLLASLFFATQAMTVLHWSRISDRIGRKPVILVGLLGLSISMYSFGLSRSFTGLVISRCLNGALNGNIGVIKSVIGELTDSTNIARTLSYQPIAWSSGSTLGPLIGGALAHPAEQFPQMFGNNEFLKAYPYFLPCAIPATFSLVAWLVTFAFLKETNYTGFSFASSFRRLVPFRQSSKCSVDESKPIDTTPAVPMRSLLTRQVILSTATYALLSFIDISYRAILPTFFAEPRRLGGLGLPPSAIGSAMACLGFTNGVFQILFFTKLMKSWGPRKCYLIGICSAIPIFALFPIMSAIVHLEDKDVTLSMASDDFHLSWVLMLLIALQLALSIILNLCYGSCFIYITASAALIPAPTAYQQPALSPASSSSSSATRVPPPSSTESSTYTKLGDGASKIHSQKKTTQGKSGKKTLGAVNGVAQCVVSVMRCVGPYCASSLYSLGLVWEYGEKPIDPTPEIPEPGPNAITLGGEEAWKHLGGMFVYIIMIVICFGTLVVGSRLPLVPWKPLNEDEVDEQ